MRVVLVVDSIENLNEKVNMLETHFGTNLCFVVKANLAPIFKTYGYPISAVYGEKAAKIVHLTLARLDVEDTIICYASLQLSNRLLDGLTARLGDGNKIINFMPRYNYFERMCNGPYNVYVKTIFKAKDSLASPKLQFLPAGCVDELLQSHIANRMFEMNPKLVYSVEVEDKATNASLKVRPKFNKYAIIPIIVVLTALALFIMSLAFWGARYLNIFIFVAVCILDVLLTIIFQFKNYFDERFLK